MIYHYTACVYIYIIYMDTAWYNWGFNGCPPTENISESEVCSHKCSFIILYPPSYPTKRWNLVQSNPNLMSKIHDRLSLFICFGGVTTNLPDLSGSGEEHPHPFASGPYTSLGTGTGTQRATTWSLAPVSSAVVPRAAFGRRQGSWEIAQKCRWFFRGKLGHVGLPEGTM